MAYVMEMVISILSKINILEHGVMDKGTVKDVYILTPIELVIIMALGSITRNKVMELKNTSKSSNI